jgi:hypothetical protein
MGKGAQVHQRIGGLAIIGTVSGDLCDLAGDLVRYGPTCDGSTPPASVSVEATDG